MFKLDEILAKDTFLIKDLKLCQLRLMNNANYHWLVLIPKRQDVSEIFELNHQDQQQLSFETANLAKILKDIFQADKMNIAAFGNVVKQLHIHVICRFKNDRVFPSPVWLDNEKTLYQENILKDKIEFLRKKIDF